MLRQRIEESKEKFLVLAKQVPILHRSTVLNVIRALRKPCNDFTIMEQMKAEKRANQALEGALETIEKERDYESTRKVSIREIKNREYEFGR